MSPKSIVLLAVVAFLAILVICLCIIFIYNPRFKSGVVKLTREGISIEMENFPPSSNIDDNTSNIQPKDEIHTE